jgi:hypothetical protein
MLDKLLLLADRETLAGVGVVGGRDWRWWKCPLWSSGASPYAEVDLRGPHAIGDGEPGEGVVAAFGQHARTGGEVRVDDDARRSGTCGRGGSSEQATGL